ncbi:hypothetical protein FKM82_021409 [Ascaphus truei]
MCSDSPAFMPFSPAKELLERAGSQTGVVAAQRDRCNSWIEHIKMRAQTIRRGSIKTSRRLFLPHYDDNLSHISDPTVATGEPSKSFIYNLPNHLYITFQIIYI